MFRLAIYFFFLSSITHAQFLTISNVTGDPPLILKENDCKIQVGTIKIIHPINMSSLERNVEKFTNIASRIDLT